MNGNIKLSGQILTPSDVRLTEELRQVMCTARVGERVRLRWRNRQSKRLSLLGERRWRELEERGEGEVCGGRLRREGRMWREVEERGRGKYVEGGGGERGGGKNVEGGGGKREGKECGGSWRREGRGKEGGGVRKMEGFGRVGVQEGRSKKVEEGGGRSKKVEVGKSREMEQRGLIPPSLPMIVKRAL